MSSPTRNLPLGTRNVPAFPESALSYRPDSDNTHSVSFGANTYIYNPPPVHMQALRKLLSNFGVIHKRRRRPTSATGQHVWKGSGI